MRSDLGDVLQVRRAAQLNRGKRQLRSTALPNPNRPLPTRNADIVSQAQQLMQRRRNPQPNLDAARTAAIRALLQKRLNQ